MLRVLVDCLILSLWTIALVYRYVLSSDIVKYPKRVMVVLILIVLLWAGEVLLPANSAHLAALCLDFAANMLGLSAIAFLVSSALAFYCQKKTFKRRNFTVIAILFTFLPVCVCQIYPIIYEGIKWEDEESKWKWIALLFAAMFFSLFHVSLSISLLGLEFTAIRSIIAFALAVFLGRMLAHFLKSPETIEENASHRECHRLPFAPKAMQGLAINFAGLSLPISMSILFAVFLRFFIPIHQLAANHALLSQFKGIALALAAAGQSCFGQELFILKAIESFYSNIRFNIGFSILSAGFCISQVPLYLKLFGKKGTAALILVLLLLIGLFAIS